MAKPFTPGSKRPYKRHQHGNSKHRKNERIRVPQVRVIDADGSQIGVIPTKEALKRAKDQGLDLVEVSPTARPPVCRILDFGKFMYEESKKQKKSTKSPTTKLKEVKFRLNIDQHDYETKVRRAESFLFKGFKVKVTLSFRGREMEHKDIGFDIVKRTIKDLEGVAAPDTPPRLVGRNISLILTPVPEKKRKLKFNLPEDTEEPIDDEEAS